MKYSDIPDQFPIIWAADASATYVRQPPEASQPAGAASLTDGFPPLTFLPPGAGGIPPDGRDMNGIDQWLSQWAQWLGAGAPQKFDSAQSSAIGGYPKGAILVGNSSGIYISLFDDNVQDFNSGSVQWQNILASFTGDSGSGGKSGWVPAPASGDAAAGKVLQAGGSWGQILTVNLANGSVTVAKLASVTGTGSTVALSVSPAFTGNPTAPTVAGSDSDTTIATTAQVHAAVAADLLLSPALGGTPTAPTASTGDNSTTVATTALVDAKIAANVYAGGSSGNLDYPIGTTIFSGQNLPSRNSNSLMRFDGVQVFGFLVGGGTNQLTGTWAARGAGQPGGSSISFWQRIL